MGYPGIESTDHIQGIAPVPLRVRLDPGKPGKIIAVPLLLTANTQTCRFLSYFKADMYPTFADGQHALSIGSGFCQNSVLQSKLDRPK